MTRQTLDDKQPNLAKLFEDEPLGKAIEDAWDAGWEGYVFGLTPDGNYALIVPLDASHGDVSVASKLTVNGRGRWECTKAHFDANVSVYYERFPLR